jgi:type I protein arginine methyltransferase
MTLNHEPEAPLPKDSTAEAATDQGLVPVRTEWISASALHYQFIANQQIMLEDTQRTGSYHAAVTANRRDFEGKTVLDLGCGTGILSLFAAQAGAKHVYAVETSSMARFATALAAKAGMQDVIEVIPKSLQELTLPERVDVLISEPWGFFLFHERIVEVFLAARDRFLKPGGMLYPALGTLWVAPYEDEELFASRLKRTAFWRQSDFYGVDLSPMAAAAEAELMAMPANGYLEPSGLMASPCSQPFDFRTMPIAGLGTIVIPFRFVIAHPGRIHGLVGWFDVTFDGSQQRVVLSTAPDEPRTHWGQIHFGFNEALTVRVGQEIAGVLTMTANADASYDIVISAELVGVKTLRPQRFAMQSQYWWNQGDG